MYAGQNPLLPACDQISSIRRESDPGSIPVRTIVEARMACVARAAETPAVLILRAGYTARHLAGILLVSAALTDKMNLNSDGYGNRRLPARGPMYKTSMITIAYVLGSIPDFSVELWVAH